MKNEWISCELLQPGPRQKRILVYSIANNIHVVHYDFVYDQWCLDETEEGSPGISIGFTHWQYLPNPPETKESEL